MKGTFNLRDNLADLTLIASPGLGSS